MRITNLTLRITNLIPIVIGLLLAGGTCLHWAVGYPCALSFAEQNQLFRYSLPYLTAHLAYPGGVCAWVAEWLTQFYYYPTLGAAIIALLLWGIYGCTLRYLSALRPTVVTASSALTGSNADARAAVLAAVLPCALLCLMGNEQVMLSYVVALLLTLMMAVSCRGCRSLAVLVAVQALLYYAVGPVAYVFALLCPRTLRHALALAATLVACLWLTRWMATPRYPWAVILHGLYYFRSVRFDLTAPAALLTLPLLVPALALAHHHIPTLRFRPALTASLACLALVAATYGGIRHCYDADKYAQLRQDYLIRRGQWQQLLDEARARQPHTAMSCTAVNLALAMTGQLPARQFDYYQCGIDGLILAQRRDNIQTLPTMEAFYRLGLIQLAEWYAYEAQQAIPDQSLSARLTQRLAECCLICGRYDVASKYIDLLRQTQFYSHWAEQAEQLLWDDALLERHTEYGRLRRLMPPVGDDCVYPHPDIDIIIGRLYAHDDSNRLAMHYFLSALLLRGKVSEFASYVAPDPQQGRVVLPHGYDAYCKRMAGNPGAEGTDAVTGASVDN